MDEPDSPRPALRIERGRADEMELAAVTAVLCSVLAGRAAAPREQAPPGEGPSWPRTAHPAAAAYRPPHSWR
ncbi:acyl-CoA carboxylase subunit epsilon [Streptomyces sp. NPDC005908]|uniref:acyl-CoA carboxylase subunit epsilon n=1 Tax=unclassified Streptomyces TaxID=2593676 RepID=UPI0011AA8AB9|nr:acyl-CoA carboxylase subunit epsilon [Streptomyces sp. T12]TWD29081.1 acyl-CoA carboxylase epsilon subunit-like protein [Streptomyces sp. T12]